MFQQSPGRRWFLQAHSLARRVRIGGDWHKSSEVPGGDWVSVMISGVNGDPAGNLTVTGSV